MIKVKKETCTLKGNGVELLAELGVATHNVAMVVGSIAPKDQVEEMVRSVVNIALDAFAGRKIKEEDDEHSKESQ